MQGKENVECFQKSVLCRVGNDPLPSYVGHTSVCLSCDEGIENLRFYLLYDWDIFR